MTFSPQSQSIIDRLLSGKKVNSGATVIGPLNQRGKILLRVICENYDELQRLTGADRAKFLSTCYMDAKENDAKEVTETEGQELLGNSLPQFASKVQPTDAGESHEPTSEKAYKLNWVECTSIRGIAPAGESVHFDFDGKSNLIYGPNGSGKTSLLGAVIWVLTGQAVSDAHERSETAPIHEVPKSGGKGKKITDWLVIATLPDGKITKDTIQECSAQIELVSSDGSSALHLRRSIADGFEVSDNGVDWNRCDGLEQFGIETLDLQLSLIAPTTFGRFTLENAPDTKSLLSMLLGYDDLDNLGKLASAISGNRTSLANREKTAIDDAWKELNRRLRPLPTELNPTHAARPTLDNLVTSAKTSKGQIENAGKEVSEFIEQAERELATLLGLKTDESVERVELADKLTGAVLALEKGVGDNFPLLGHLRLDTVFPPSDETSSDDLLEAHVQKLSEFLRTAGERIRERLDWWRDETAPGSKATLLLQAAQYYEPAEEACPVCEQSIKHLPVKDELSRLKDVDPELKEEVKNFFRNLCMDFDAVIPIEVRNLAVQPPQKRILTDWKKLASQTLPAEFSPLVANFRPQIEKIANELTVDEPEPTALLPKDAEKEFAEFAIEFVQAVGLARNAISILQWSQRNLGEAEREIHNVVTASLKDETHSLLGALSVGKEAAAAVAPLTSVREELRRAYKDREAIAKKEAEYALLEELRSPLDDLKVLNKYAESEVQHVFADIRANTISNWKTMYPEESSGLAPARLVVGSGRDKSVTAYLSKGDYEVPEQFFGNAGLQRAVALSFYFALLEKHPRGLGFAIMDDPILSLDDSHRERWSREILKPRMDRVQFIVATHQKHYFSNCRNDFVAGNVYQLNDRPWPRRVSWRPGNRLERAASEIQSAPDNAPYQMRMFCEELLATLETYARTPFVVQNSLVSSIDAYAALPATDPLASDRRSKIVALLRDSRVTNVLNPGSHHRTQANVTNEMIRDCLSALREANHEFRPQLARLEKEYHHSRRQAVIPTSVITFGGLPTEATWMQPIELDVFGRAAAKGESWVVDVPGDLGVTSVPSGAAVLVTSDALDPVAKRGQWVLLAAEDVSCNDGDLVAVMCASGERLLRRIWSSGDNWTFQSINSVRPIKSFVAPKVDSAPRKIVGVLYQQHPSPGSSTDATMKEWQPREDFQVNWVKNLASVFVEGSSLDPIARAGQRVLIDKEPTTDHRNVTNGDLAVVDTKIDSIGRVIKRVYHRGEYCVLTSPNPVDPHPPEMLNETQLVEAVFWIVRGVLFESND